MKTLFSEKSKMVIPVIVLDDVDHAEPLAEALLEGGMNIIEITFRTAAAAESIRRIRTRFPEMIVGAGTLVTPEQIEKAIDSGIVFGLAPGLNPSTVRRFREVEIPFVPGVATPSDIEQALELGCRHLKYFPAADLGGTKMLKSMSAPYLSLGVSFCPTGGIGPGNLLDYLGMPQVFAVGGSWLATKQQIGAGAWSSITNQVKEAQHLIATII